MPAYNQFQAMLAITKGSFKAIFRNPSAVVFSFAFPLIFILVFGFIGSGGNGPVYRIAFDPANDSTNALYDSILRSNNIQVTHYANAALLEENLVKGRITGVVKIEKNMAPGAMPAYYFKFRSTTASNDRIPQFLSLMNNLIYKVTVAKLGRQPSYAAIAINPGDIRTVREYKTI